MFVQQGIFIAFHCCFLQVIEAAAQTRSYLIKEIFLLSFNICFLSGRMGEKKNKMIIYAKMQSGKILVYVLVSFLF